MNSPTILERIRKFLALSRDERANPHERHSASAHAEKLMRDNDLTENDVHGATTVEVPVPGEKWPTWRLAILFACAKVRGCALIRRNAGKTVLCRVVGRKLNADEAVYLYRYLARATKDALAVTEYSLMNSKKLKDAFKRGMSKAIMDRLKNADFARTDDTITRYLEKNHADAQDHQGDKERGDPDAFADGYQQGMDIHIPDPRKPDGQKLMVTDGR